MSPEMRQNPRRSASRSGRARWLTSVASVSIALCIGPSAAETPRQRAVQDPRLPSETPQKFEPVTSSFDHVGRDVMIPMRDDWPRTLDDLV